MRPVTLMDVICFPLVIIFSYSDKITKKKKKRKQPQIFRCVNNICALWLGLIVVDHCHVVAPKVMFAVWRLSQVM